MPTVLVTGSSGLVGSACVRYFHAMGWRVRGVDNNSRRDYFGPDGNTGNMRYKLWRELNPRPELFGQDVRHNNQMAKVVRDAPPDLVIHAAAQPSHDWAATNPLVDFEVNATGTLNLLEAVRCHAPAASFVFLSTNKVYGAAPNYLPLREEPTRYDYNFLSEICCNGWGEPMDCPNGESADSNFGIRETFDIDQSTHSLFGCSKLAADLYTQEYGRYFGLNTVCFRCGCLTGAAHAGAEQHGFLAYLARCCREGRPYRVYGYQGKQVRDQLHAADVARACEEFAKAPRAGEVYNLGGGRANSISVLEAIAEIERRVGKRLACEYVDEPRRGDHQVWISDTRKFQEHYPGWRVRVPLAAILDEICGVEHGAEGHADSSSDDSADTPAARSY